MLRVRSGRGRLSSRSFVAGLAEVAGVCLSVTGADPSCRSVYAWHSAASAVVRHAPLTRLSAAVRAADVDGSGIGVRSPDRSLHDVASDASVSGLISQTRSFLELPAAGTDSTRGCLVAALAAASQLYPAAAEAR